MQHFLRVGQVFRCARFRDLLSYVTETSEGSDGPIQVDRNRMETHHHHTKQVTSCWTEHGQGGWERKRETVIDLSLEDGATIGTTDFTVLETRLCGGGTGHGPGDVFPDGHQVVAREVDGNRLVRFYQSGCFTGMVPPEEVEFVEGPPDATPFHDWPAGRPRSAWSR